MVAINLRNIPPALRQQLKSEAALRGLTLSAYILRILENRSQGLWAVEDVHCELVQKAAAK